MLLLEMLECTFAIVIVVVIVAVVVVVVIVVVSAVILTDGGKHFKQGTPQTIVVLYHSHLLLPE